MYTYEIINLINSQQGKLTIEQYNHIYDTSPQLENAFLDMENVRSGYKFSMLFRDKEEPVLFNLM